MVVNFVLILFSSNVGHPKLSRLILILPDSPGLAKDITQFSLHFKTGKHSVFDPSGPKLTDSMGEKSLQGGETSVYWLTV